MFYEHAFTDGHGVKYQKKIKKKTLYDLLEDLSTNKINTNNANVDQLNFIINLKLGYDKNDNLVKKQSTQRKKWFWRKKYINKAEEILYK